ncbi:hypothetical protein ACT3SQ_05005 [Brachybacterium sp. AOP42-C2-15]|uniref:hypothetical protein n=1 Tax=Brachybacterium TaxID=43668 RepID=UPI0031EF40EE
MIIAGRILLLVVSFVLFGWALALFVTGGTTRVMLEERIDSEHFTAVIAEIKCGSVAEGLNSHVIYDVIDTVDGEEAGAVSGPTGSGNELLIGQSCESFRSARSTGITLLAAPTIVAGVGGFALSSRRK